MNKAKSCAVCDNDLEIKSGIVASICNNPFCPGSQGSDSLQDGRRCPACGGHRFTLQSQSRNTVSLRCDCGCEFTAPTVALAQLPPRGFVFLATKLPLTT